MISDISLLQHAAQLLETDARDLRECHNTDAKQPDWKGEPEARAAHDNALCTALELRMLARRMKAGQVASASVSLKGKSITESFAHGDGL